MISFACDYLQGAHPAVLQRLVDTNLDTQPGYGEDVYCQTAKEKIRTAFDCPDADVWFLTGGTQTNAVVIRTLLSPVQGVICAQSGHIAVHESGAIEYTGHKVLPLPAHDGKLDAAEVEAYLEAFYADQTWPHCVAPGMVYISHPTEYGTLYTADELRALSAVCRRANIPLFMDGARLGYGLMSHHTDVTPAMVAELCDVFSIGGTKVGALCGEAVVFRKGRMPEYMLSAVKQQGALLAKGRLFGVQFDALFTDDLYFTISRHAIDMAEKMKDIFRRKQYTFRPETDTNQQFICLENSVLQRLQPLIGFSVWEKADDTHTVVRFATSWATTEEDLAYLDSVL